MNALLIKSVIFSEEPDTLETAENSGAVLVPDPDSENGYRVEEAPSTWKTLTEEEYVAESSSKNAIENMGLSSKFPFLFAPVSYTHLAYKAAEPRSVGLAACISSIFFINCSAAFVKI